MTQVTSTRRPKTNWQVLKQRPTDKWQIAAVDLTLLNFTFVGSSKAATRVEKLVKVVHGSFHTRLKLDP